MKKIILIAVFLFSVIGNTQDIFGKWKTIDDQDNKEKSIVEIYEHDGKVFGKIIEIFEKSKTNDLCTKCKGEDFNKPILGLEIIKDMTKSGDYYKKGTILDPRSGKVYTCRLILDKTNPNRLLVRGYISFLYATQYWERITD